MKKVLVGVGIAVALVLVALLFWRPGAGEVLLPLSELPEVSQDVLACQGSLFRIEEPFLYNRKTGMAVFVVEVLSTKNFGDETRLTFGGDAQSLQYFAHEVRLVNSGPERFSGVGTGIAEGVESLVSGVWHLLRHPIDTINGLGSGAVALGSYLKDTSFEQVRADVTELADAFFVNMACEVAEGHSLDYFELKTDAGKAAIHSETKYRLGGQSAVELATFLVAFTKIKYAAKAAEVGEAAAATGKGAEAARTAEALTRVSELSSDGARFGKAGLLFPRMAERMAATLERLRYAAKPSRAENPVAMFGKAASGDYRATFLEKYPGLEGKVIVHHAVEQQVLERYPGVVTPEEIHSLENLRGIPKGLDTTLHKSHIAKEWNAFYRANPAGTVTKESLLGKATEIDRRFGHLFEPKLL